MSDLQENQFDDVIIEKLLKDKTKHEKSLSKIRIEIRKINGKISSLKSNNALIKSLRRSLIILLAQYKKKEIAIINKIKEINDKIELLIESNEGENNNEGEKKNDVVGYFVIGALFLLILNQ